MKTQDESNLANNILIRDEYIGELWGMLYYLEQYQYGLLEEALDDEMLEKFHKLVQKNLK